jgi:isoleucyl-tRNA synthetase
MRFSQTAVREAQKDFLIKLRNVYSFFTIYANIDGYDPEKEKSALIDSFQGTRLTELDRWIRSEMAIAIMTIRQKLDAFDVFGASQILSTFVNSLSNWYVRRSRSRFWRAWENKENKSSIADEEKLSAYWTLYDCLLTTAQLAAPFTPFLAEELWGKLLRTDNNSVHLSDYPEPWEPDIDSNLSYEITQIRKIVSLGHAARADLKIRTRQPLSKAILFFNDSKMADIVNAHKTIIMEELNVKEVELGSDPNKYVEFEFKPNFKLLGAKYRGLVPAIGQAISKAAPMQINKELAQGKINLSIGKDEIVLLPDEIQMFMKARSGYAASGDQNIVVVLDPTLTQELIEEGIAREFVNSINSWRGELNLPYEQRIKLAIRGNPKLEEIVRKHAEYICNETLALQDMSIGTIPEWKTRYVKIDEEVIEVGIFV